MQDRPTYAEVLAAVRHFIETDVVPRLEGPRKFHARVAANVLSIVERELCHEDTQLRAEFARLATLLGSDASTPQNRAALRAAIRNQTVELCRRIQDGAADTGVWREAVVAHTRATVREKLEVANPKYLKSDDEMRSGERRR